MSRNAKNREPQENSARRGWVEPASRSALGHTNAALARAGFTDATLVLRWAEIVGHDVARVAVPLKLSQGPNGATLTLKCESSAAVFLQHQTRQIAERLNAYLGGGAIARIALVPGKLARAAEPPQHPAANRPKSDDKERPPTLAGALESLASARAGRGKVPRRSRAD